MKRIVTRHQKLVDKFLVSVSVLGIKPYKTDIFLTFNQALRENQNRVKILFTIDVNNVINLKFSETILKSLSFFKLAPPNRHNYAHLFNSCDDFSRKRAQPSNIGARKVFRQASYKARLASRSSLAKLMIYFNGKLCRRLTIRTTYHKNVKPRNFLSFLPTDPYRNIRRQLCSVFS